MFVPVLKHGLELDEGDIVKKLWSVIQPEASLSYIKSLHSQQAGNLDGINTDSSDFPGRDSIIKTMLFVVDNTSKKRCLKPKTLSPGSNL